MIARHVALAAVLCLFVRINGTAASTPNSVAPFETGPPPSEKLKTIFDEMQREDDILELTLETDLSYLIDNRPSEDYQQATLRFELPGQGEVSRSANIRLRGKYRRRVCAFPPLKLKFPEEELRQAGLDPVFRSLKLVTHCLDDKFDGNQNVFKEYLAYKLYNLLSDNSYRVQLVKITYLDTAGKQSKTQRYGFIIEDTDEMAYRIGGKECDECRNPEPGQLEEKEAALLSMFQFMIGNADWDMVMMRNLKYVELLEGDKGRLVPYDFDFAGLVDASYARPNSNFNQTSIRERIFLGQEYSDDVMKWTVNYFKFKEEEILNYVQKFKALSLLNRRDVKNYLEFFFQYLDDIDVRNAERLYQYFSKNSLPYQAASEESGKSDMGS